MESATATGSGTTSGIGWSNVTSTTIDVTNVSKVLVTASMNMRSDGANTNTREANYRIYRELAAADNSGIIKREIYSNSETGVEFQSSVENKLMASYTSSMSAVTYSIGNFFREKSSDTLALAKIFKTQRDTQLSFEETAKETIAYHFIKANKPYIPKGFEDVETYINNLKVHYFWLITR